MTGGATASVWLPAYVLSKMLASQPLPGDLHLKRTVVRTARLSIGSLLIVAGIISGFIPILQGWILIIAGLSIMAPESARAQKALDWAKAKLGRNKKKEEGGSSEPAKSQAEHATGTGGQGPQ